MNILKDFPKGKGLCNAEVCWIVSLNLGREFQACHIWELQALLSLVRTSHSFFPLEDLSEWHHELHCWEHLQVGARKPRDAHTLAETTRWKEPSSEQRAEERTSTSHISTLQSLSRNSSSFRWSKWNNYSSTSQLLELESSSQDFGLNCDRYLILFHYSKYSVLFKNIFSSHIITTPLRDLHPTQCAFVT